MKYSSAIQIVSIKWPQFRQQLVKPDLSHLPSRSHMATNSERLQPSPPYFSSRVSVKTTEKQDSVD